jgi:hypothetical protein
MNIPNSLVYFSLGALACAALSPKKRRKKRTIKRIKRIPGDLERDIEFDRRHGR